MTLRPEADARWMRLALDQAAEAQRGGDVPVGAVVVVEDELIGAGGNRVVRDRDPTAHAEILALRQAAQALGNFRLPDAVLYVTLEPCCMCAGALIHARVRKVVYGARDPKTGAAGSVHDVLNAPEHNHRPLVHGGVLAEESDALLQAFFQARRRD
ncbi:MAG: tRNA adenosine(34) deaminase TadA [Xanthomonadales bacterium]|nr:tRNA adenosine(34) deaminase TadA [Xanthomonadales bacterium]